MITIFNFRIMAHFLAICYIVCVDVWVVCDSIQRLSQIVSDRLIMISKQAYQKQITSNLRALFIQISRFLEIDTKSQVVTIELNFDLVKFLYFFRSFSDLSNFDSFEFL